MKILGVSALGAFLVAALTVQLVALASLIAVPANSSTPVPLYPGSTTMVMAPTVFVVVSLVGGALGGTLHGIASLTAHVAAGDFDKKWTLWYLANPFIGAALATAFLFVLQAGLGGQAAPSAQSGLYGIAAVATLIGLFSRHALNKLKEIFDVAFARADTAGDQAQGR
jgi:hypothetical protein